MKFMLEKIIPYVSLPLSPVSQGINTQESLFTFYCILLQNSHQFLNLSFAETFHFGLCSRERDRSVKQCFQYSGGSLSHSPSLWECSAVVQQKEK